MKENRDGPGDVVRENPSDRPTLYLSCDCTHYQETEVEGGPGSDGMKTSDSMRQISSAGNRGDRFISS